MRVLVGWDNSGEAETIDLCLNVDGTFSRTTQEANEFLKLAQEEQWDTVLMSLTFPDAEKAFDLFQQIKDLQPQAPFIGAWKPGHMMMLPQFIKRGMQFHITRDANGEFIFLLMALLEAALENAQAERDKQLALRLQEEVASVRRLQESVIPRDLRMPKGYAIAARYEPAQIRVMGGHPVVLAGGDYYDIFRLSNDDLVLLVGDASGHGMKACMSIMTMRTLINMIREQRYDNTSGFVGAVNDRLCVNEIIRDEGGFITVLYCNLDTKSGILQWTSAGHPMPLLQNLGTNEITVLGGPDAGGIPLGVASEFSYDICTAEIPPNSRVLLYTDGLAEAFPEDGDAHCEFGMDGILKTMKATVNLSVDDALEKLFQTSHDFTGGLGRHDDTSVVLVERKS